MSFEEEFPNIKSGYEMHIVESPFTKGKLAIAYTWAKKGEWYHKDEIDNGFKVLRFSETEINNNIFSCIKKIIGEISGQSPIY